MAEPITLALGVAIGKLLMRWADLNDTADALEDARAGFGALQALGSMRATGPVGSAITELLEQRLAGVRDQDRRDQMKIAVLNVEEVFTDLTDADIVAAAQHPQGFPDYLARGPGGRLLHGTEDALTPFTRRLMDVGAAVFAEIAPRSGRFTTGALLRLLDQVDAITASMTGLHDDLMAARTELFAASKRVTERVEDLHTKTDRLLNLTAQSHSSPDPADASIRAARAGVVLGPPLRGWEPDQLGVHASITVNDETTLTPYTRRQHDRDLRTLLATFKDADARTGLILVVGTSCSGKTRTLYEAIKDALPDWPVTTPPDDTTLARELVSGVPAGTVVWLDEAQRHITMTADGITAAKAMRHLRNTNRCGPILFAGTIWPANLTELSQRPSNQQAAAGGQAIQDLINVATTIEVPDVFTDIDLADTSTQGDARMMLAIDSATTVDLPELLADADADTDNDARIVLAMDVATSSNPPRQGRKITQLLAGGTTLIQRLHPPEGTHPTNEFSPAAKALLLAAGDLRRAGLPNPIPRWALEGTAPGYLTTPTKAPAHTWLDVALVEATRDARADDPLTDTRTLDIHHHGVPALTPSWTTTPDGDTVAAYDLHDYLFQDHLTRHRRSPTRNELWATLTSHAAALEPSTRWSVAVNAEQQGLLTTAITLHRISANNDSADAPWRLADLLADVGDDASLAELRARADTGDHPARQRLAWLLAERGDAPSLAELRARADTGDRPSQRRLAWLLAERGDDASLTELRARADTSDEHAQERLADLLVWRGDEISLIEVRDRAGAGDQHAQRRLAWLLVWRGDEAALAELRARAGAGDLHAHQQLAHLLTRRGDSAARTELRARTDVVDETLTEIAAAAVRNEELIGVPTGFIELDELTHGLYPGQLIVLAARQAVGKSTLGLDIARSAAIKHEMATAVFSLEMSRFEITMRLLSAEASIQLQNMRKGTMRDEDQARLARTMGEVSDAPLFIDDSMNMSLVEMRARCRRLQQHSLKLVIVDYLQLMSSGKKVESRRQEVSELSRGLKMLAKELEVPVIVISQLTRGPETRTDKRPQMSDLREPGAVLVQDADIVILLHRDRSDPDREGQADLIVAKHRNGPTKDIVIAFQGHYSRFANMAQDF